MINAVAPPIRLDPKPMPLRGGWDIAGHMGRLRLGGYFPQGPRKRNLPDALSINH